MWQESGIKKFTVSGQELSTRLNFTVEDYYRQFYYQGYVFGIIQTNEDYKSDDISGYIGIGPYSLIEHLPDDQHITKGENFLYQLRAENHIEYQIISFYLDQNNTMNSFVKYGSYDPECFQDPENIMVIKTTDDTGWRFQSPEISIWLGETQPVTFSDHKVIIEPAYPFFHVP